MRADAQRNRTRILDAARALVVEIGADATMDEIAARAGVAVGTLYRHFPAKEHLVAAVVDDSVTFIAERTVAALAAADAGSSPGVELVGLFRELADRHATDRAFKAAAGRLDVAAWMADTSPQVARAFPAVADLLARAQSAGTVRADLTVADLALLLGSVPGAEVPAEMRSRFVDVVVAGLVPRVP